MVDKWFLGGMVFVAGGRGGGGGGDDFWGVSRWG